MKSFVTTISITLLLFSSIISKAQFSEPWRAFIDSNDLRGYKDNAGTIKIPPRFTGLTSAHLFRNIIAVNEEKNGKYESYYLLKDGKIVGNDSLYVWDFTVDCETNGLIRFRDWKTDKVGFFDNLGKVAIPAIYCDVSRIRNGMAIVLIGAKRNTHDEHPTWLGGTVQLIDTKNNMLIREFKDSHLIDWFSVKVTNAPESDSMRFHYKGEGGKYYSFINLEKEFRHWFTTKFLNTLTPAALAQHSFSKICTPGDSREWLFTDKNIFLENNSEFIALVLEQIKAGQLYYDFSPDFLNDLIYNGDLFSKYYDDCGQHLFDRYPVISMYINHGSGKDQYQDQFEFLKTDEGYKLICVSLGKG